ncbi:orf129 [Artaxa digramma nucleopolyhedrovirus]|uniref:Orf129 n=1 Tax=Artaxa digramma nucleopolyhedrovirus TaxID=3070910 RepID=A0AAE6UZN5_9ABAC|nr:orf129 [Euproctis digramma nucleopolyhedrovirus]QHB21788.1 orf129 [Artaxa digramma nucleopolyhedrovirus]
MYDSFDFMLYALEEKLDCFEYDYEQDYEHKFAESLKLVAPFYVKQILIVDNTGWSFVYRRTVDNDEFCSKIKKLCTINDNSASNIVTDKTKSNDNNSNADTDTDADDDDDDSVENQSFDLMEAVIDLFVQSICALESELKHCYIFIKNMMHYTVDDLDLPYYAGKTFYRTVDEKQKEIFNFVISDDEISTWMLTVSNVIDDDTHPEMCNELEKIREDLHSVYNDNDASWEIKLMTIIENAASKLN